MSSANDIGMDAQSSSSLFVSASQSAYGLDSVSVRRHIYTHDNLVKVYPKTTPPKRSIASVVRERCACTRKRAGKLVTSFFPILGFLWSYKPRQYILGDFLSGLTVSFIHLPQGLGFGILAGLTPVYGLYSTFYPVLFYMLLGTSPHISFGTNAVMALITEGVVKRETELYLAEHPMIMNSSTGITLDPIMNSSSTAPSILPQINREAELLGVKVGVAMTSSMIAGLILAGLGIFRLGFITTYMSVSFIGAFTTAAAVHIASSQVPKALGIAVNSYSGPGKLVKFYIDVFTNIHLSKPPEVIIALICMAVLLIVKVGINERFKEKLKLPIPIDLVVVILGTIISHFANFKGNFDVKIVGTIPSGLPAPKVPDLSFAGRIISDCVLMAVLSLAMSISMAKLTAKMNSITINDNQELVAYGLSNAASSFFFCFPSATAPPRTMLLSSLGAKTTLNAIPTSLFMFLVLMWIGQLFESLPVSVLAAVVIVAVKDLLLQFRNLPNIWRINKYDFIIWVITCSVSVLVDLSYGIIAGIGISILLIVVQHQLASGQIIGMSDSEDDVFLDIRFRTKMQELAGVKIFQFQAPLYFANAERFKAQLYEKVINPVRAKRKLAKQSINENDVSVTVNGIDNPVMADKELNGLPPKEATFVHVLDIPKHLVLDFKLVAHIDMAGVNVLQQVIKEFKEIDTAVSLTRCSKSVMQTLHASKFLDQFPKERVFYEIIDAVETIKRKSSNEITKL